MTELKQFRLPDVGEGLTEAEIVTWHVKPGDRVEDGQVIVDIEAAKGVVELPSPWDGVVTRLLAEEGQTVDVGAPIIAIQVGDPGGTAPSEPAATGSGQGKTDFAERAVVPPAAPAGQSAAGEPQGSEPQGSEPQGGEPQGGEPQGGEPQGGEPQRHAVLVGYGVKASATTRRARKATATRPETAEVPTLPDTPTEPPRLPTAPTAATAATAATAQAAAAAAQAEPAAPGVRTLAKPPVRKLAKDLGISLASVTGSGPDGSITRDDVHRAASDTTVRSAEMVSGNGAGAATPAAALSRGGEERIPVRGVRKHMAAAMVASAFTAPHVTEFLQVDVTETMAALPRVRDLPEFAGLRVSPLLFVARALIVAAGRHPLINSSWDEAAQEIVVRHYVNLGIAVAADRGLLVPNVKNAGELTLPGLARSLQGLAETARAGKATPADLSGGTITITNVGVFGIDAGTPILTPGEAAILAFGQVRDVPWVVDGQLAVRAACTLSLSFDHRIVDGELGSAVLRDVGAMLADPVRMLAWS
jgi:2-oxoisovalerate dehydrogenase E2 component (dihydrolipoyl transacylase)